MENQQDSAQLLALRALAWLASDDDLFPAFLDSTGASVSAISSRAQDDDFLGAILDFLLMDDQRVVAFCDLHQFPYTAVQAARVALPGGAVEHWT